ncbi:VOC family protein [cf. Phormidesmis sp. LEGE 11477]|uniref:VOC family protein n=1 Tax=cf. Phormidesmis sp. LEGE 11477 TaxID=1828680 RepID=UPI00187E66CF|nr:VOC family protein [cf. Phormidesmis sp. LEGE 11477]
MYASPPICNLLVLRSPDIERAATFYSQMGLLFTKHAHGNGPKHYTSTVDGFVFEIYPARSSDDTTTRTRLGFSVDDVDSIVEMLLEIGATLRTKPTDSEWGRRAVVHDLDGHVVELVTPPNRDPSYSSQNGG